MGALAMKKLGALLCVLGTLAACTAPYETTIGSCDPAAIYPGIECRNGADAGTDAESDAGTDAESNMSSAKDNPGLDPSLFFPDPNACKGDCVPEASGPTALDWTWEPLVVWFGSKSEVDTKTCPPETPYEKARGFNNLVASPAKCDACACLPQGSCTGLPETIEIRSGMCSASTVETTPFDGPPNWGGTCTSVNAMAAGKLCNGVPCAQSVSTSTLPAPTNESCTPTVEKPNATIDKHEWLDGALACNAKDLTGTCAAAPEHCVNTLREGWLHCLARTGKHDVCPANYNDYGPRRIYDDNPIDDRGCSACACGAPKNSICIGSLSVYADGSCMSEFIKLPLSSIDPSCGTITPPGRAVGSKTINNLSYVPGTCAATGGEPIGLAIPNDNSGVTTICCRAPGPPPPPPVPPPR